VAPAAAPLDVEIAQQLGARLGVVIAVRCTTAQACEAVLPDRGTLPIAVRQVAGAWEWHVERLIVTTDQLEAYLRDEVAALGVAQTVRCAPRIRALIAGERVECRLERGGAAFVTVGDRVRDRARPGGGRGALGGSVPGRRPCADPEISRARRSSAPGRRCRSARRGCRRSRRRVRRGKHARWDWLASSCADSSSRARSPRRETGR
jgi:hypothetical protein